MQKTRLQILPTNKMQDLESWPRNRILPGNANGFPVETETICIDSTRNQILQNCYYVLLKNLGQMIILMLMLSTQEIGPFCKTSATESFLL